MIKLLLMAVLAAGGLAVAATGSAVAAPAAGPDRAQAAAQLGRQARTMTELQQQVDLQLRLAPGGKQTAANEVAYGNGKFVVTYAMPGATITGSPDCPSGWFCFYDHTSWGYPRGKLSDCGWQDLAAYGWSDRTESLDNSTGSRIDYIQHEDYGNPANGHAYDYGLFYNPAHSAYSSVPYPNQADHVFRYC